MVKSLGTGEVYADLVRIIGLVRAGNELVSKRLLQYGRFRVEKRIGLGGRPDNLVADQAELARKSLNG